MVSAQRCRTTAAVQASEDFLYVLNAGLTARSGRRIAATARSGRFAPARWTARRPRSRGPRRRQTLTGKHEHMGQASKSYARRSEQRRRRRQPRPHIPSASAHIKP